MEIEIAGTVELSLADYHRLKDAHERAMETKQRLVKISEQLEIFLSFIAIQDVVKKAITEFNVQSSVCQIHLDDGRVKIEMMGI